MSHRRLHTMIRAFGLGLCLMAGFQGVSQASPKAGVRQDLLREAGQATWVAEGQGHRIVYVIFDPNCPYCHLVYDDSQPYLREYQFRWVPVGILTPTSRGKAAAMLMAQDPKAALQTNEDDFVRARGKLGGLKPLLRISGKASQALVRNRLLLQRTGLAVVPTILFLDKRGKVKIIKGAPAKSDFAFLLHKVADLPDAY